MLFATDCFGWVYKFKFNSNGIGLTQVGKQILVPAKICLRIQQLNDFQVVVQNLMGLTIVNINEGKTDFKFKFVDKYNFELTHSNGYLSVPRK